MADAYLHIDDDIIWTLIVDAVPELPAALQTVLETAAREGGQMARKPKKPTSVETHTREEATRRNIPTAEHHPVMSEEDKTTTHVALGRRNRHLERQLV